MQKVLTNIRNIQSIERTDQNEITITTDSAKSIRYKFNIDTTKIPSGKTQVGLYRDIIENVETGDVEVIQDHNDITELFAKYLVYRLFINNGIVETIDYDRYFNIPQDSQFLSMIKPYKQTSDSEFTLPLSKYLGIHSWEVGIGHESWDSPQNEYGFTYNEYGFPIHNTTGSGGSDTYIPYSSLQIYKDTIQKQLISSESQYNNTNITHHNSLICRIPPQLLQYTNFYQIGSTQKTYSLYSYRKPVQVFFVIPTQYLLDDNTIVTNPIEILRKLKTGEYVTERVIEWLPYTGKNDIYGINETLINEMKVNYIIPEFIMVQQIFEPFEANFTWREFGILAGFNTFVTATSGTTNLDTIETEENEPNASLMAWMKHNNMNISVSEFHPLVYPRGVFIDYKVHKAINKTRNMRITRQIIFGILNISSQLL